MAGAVGYRRRHWQEHKSASYSSVTLRPSHLLLKYEYEIGIDPLPGGHVRLRADEIRIIREEVERAFGAHASVRLFGSRVDDHYRGGDIDLYIEANGTPAELLDRELRLHARLQQRLGEQRIDLIVHGRDAPLRAVDQHARQTGEPL
jgi:hypothetical protein